MTATPAVLAAHVQKQEDEAFKNNEYFFEFKKDFLDKHCKSIIKQITSNIKNNIEEEINIELAYIKEQNLSWFRRKFPSFQEPETYDYANQKLLNLGLKSPLLIHEVSHLEQLNICKSLVELIKNTKNKTIKINEYQKDFLNL